MKLRYILNEVVKDDIKKCPAATQDVALNTAVKRDTIISFNSGNLVNSSN